MPKPAVPQQRPLPAATARAFAPLWVAVLLAVLVTLLRVLLARHLDFCGTPDACFYLGLAQNLSTGHGFQARFLYDFQQAHPTLPNTGLEYWRPGVSLLLLLLKPFGGVTLHASIVLTILVGVVFSGAAWHLAKKVFADPRLALGAFALCLVSSPVWIGSATPDSGLYYGAAVAWFLALFTPRRQGLLQDLIALVCAGLAYLIRNDALLLLVPLLAVLWARARDGQASRTGAPRNGTSLAYAGLMVLGFFAALAPMHLLYKAVLGTAFPSGTAQALYLNDLSDFVRYGEPATLHTLLAHGVRHLVLVRISTFAAIVYRVAVLMVGFPALIFLPALVVRSPDESLYRTDAQNPLWQELLGPCSFGLTMLLVYSAVMPAIGAFSALRTAVALMPTLFVLVLLAIVRGARSPVVAGWLIGALVIANAVTGFMEARRDLPAANAIGMADRTEAKTLAELGANPASAVILTGDPVQFSVTTGYAAIALPGNGLDAIANAARDFRATHVILDSNTLPASPEELQRQLQPVRSVTLPREHSLILELPQTAAGR